MRVERRSLCIDRNIRLWPVLPSGNLRSGFALVPASPAGCLGGRAGSLRRQCGRCPTTHRRTTKTLDIDSMILRTHRYHATRARTRRDDMRPVERRTLTLLARRRLRYDGGSAAVFLQRLCVLHFSQRCGKMLQIAWRTHTDHGPVRDDSRTLCLQSSLALQAFAADPRTSPGGTPTTHRRP